MAAKRRMWEHFARHLPCPATDDHLSSIGTCLATCSATWPKAGDRPPSFVPSQKDSNFGSNEQKHSHTFSRDRNLCVFPLKERGAGEPQPPQQREKITIKRKKTTENYGKPRLQHEIKKQPTDNSRANPFMTNSAVNHTHPPANCYMRRRRRRITVAAGICV